MRLSATWTSISQHHGVKPAIFITLYHRPIVGLSVDIAGETGNGRTAAERTRFELSVPVLVWRTTSSGGQDL